MSFSLVSGTGARHQFFIQFLYENALHPISFTRGNLVFSGLGALETTALAQFGSCGQTDWVGPCRHVGCWTISINASVPACAGFLQFSFGYDGVGQRPGDCQLSNR